jgi:hypothetical protein
VEDHKTLKGRAVISEEISIQSRTQGRVPMHTSHTTNAVNDAFNKRLADSVVTTSI